MRRPYLPLLTTLLAGCRALTCGPGTVLVGDECRATAPAPDSGDTGGPALVEAYLLVGQSNMVGWAPTTGLPPSLRVAQPDVPLFWSEEGRFGPLQPSSRLGLGYTGPEPSFGRTLADAGRRVALVKEAVGGTSLATWWYPGASDADPAAGEGWIALLATLDAAAAELDAAGEPWRWAGVAMLQGETDAWDEAEAAAFGENLARFVARLRDTVGDPELPFAIGELHCADQCPWNDEVVAAQEAVAATVEGVTVVDTSDLTGRPGDPKHLDGPSMRVLGERLAQAFLGEPPAPAPQAAVALTAWTADVTGAYTLGWRFTTTAPLTVTDVGSFGEAELGAAAAWGLWEHDTQALIARGAVPAAAEAPTSWRDGFWYAAVDPFTLPPGDYVLGVATWDDDGDAHANGCTGTVASALTIVEGRYVGGEGWLAFPEYPGGRALGFMGPSFLYVEGGE